MVDLAPTERPGHAVGGFFGRHDDFVLQQHQDGAASGENTQSHADPVACSVVPSLCFFSYSSSVPVCLFVVPFRNTNERQLTPAGLPDVLSDARLVWYQVKNDEYHKIDLLPKVSGV